LSTDLAAVLEQRDLRDVVLVAHSMGSGEAVRYLARPGRERVSKLVLVAPTTPFIRKTDDNPHGVPGSLIDGMLDEVAHDFPKWVSDNEAPFFTPDTPQETRTWIKTMMLGVPLPIALTHRDQAGRTDFRADTREVRQPTLILHGDKDASAPLSVTGARTLELLRDGKLVVYENAPHALPLTHRERFLQDLESFART
jgi:pimeloyl-ACP methyl ester carboxylesterase